MFGEKIYSTGCIILKNLDRSLANIHLEHDVRANKINKINISGDGFQTKSSYEISWYKNIVLDVIEYPNGIWVEYEVNNEIISIEIPKSRYCKVIEKEVKKELSYDLYKSLKDLVRDKLDNPQGIQIETQDHDLKLVNCTRDKWAREYIYGQIRYIIVNTNLVPPDSVDKYAYDIYSDLYGMGVIQELDDKEDIGEILVNITERPFSCKIYYYKDGRKIKFDKGFKNIEEVTNVFSRAVDFKGMQINRVDTALAETTRSNGDRVSIFMPDACYNYAMNIRKFSNFRPNAKSMEEIGTITPKINSLMQLVVDSFLNIGIGGAMNTGKTSFISYLLTLTKPDDRKVIVAAVNEFLLGDDLKEHDILIFEVDETKDFTFKRLNRAAMRSTSSRLIVPESRNEEFRQVYEANLKTRGNIFTAHALNSNDFLETCIDMYIGDSPVSNEERVRNKIAKSIDIIIIMQRIGFDIRIKSISEVIKDENNKFKNINDLMVWDFDKENPTKGKYKFTGSGFSDRLKYVMNEMGVPMRRIESVEREMLS